MANRLKIIGMWYILLSGLLYAAPLENVSLNLRQPDGSKVPVIISGDDYFQHIESPDGFSLVRDTATGWIRYANLTADSILVPSKLIYKGKQKDERISSSRKRHLKHSRYSRLKKHASVRARFCADSDQREALTASGIKPMQGMMGSTKRTGSFLGLTICIDFSDQPASIPLDSIEHCLNMKNYTAYRNNGSVYDYYYDVSGGKVEYTNIVVGYYRAKKPKSYYDSWNSSFGVRAQELIKEALNWLENEGFDYSQLSVNDRDRVMAVNFMYAGKPEVGWSEGLWPHQGNLNTISFDGVVIRRYQISNIGTSLTIGTFCHENGHMLFDWPDLYDYGGESSGVGKYCIMSTTDYINPVPPCAYLRDFSGWEATTDITDYPEGLVLSSVPNSSKPFKYRNKANEYQFYIIESRRREGRSRLLPDSGFLILLVDKRGSNDNKRATQSSHYLVTVIQADGKWDLEWGRNMGDRTDLFRKNGVDRFDGETDPTAMWWDGTKSGLKVWNMSDVGDTMTFSIGPVPSSTQHTLSVKAEGRGSVIPSGTIKVPTGENFSFAVVPDSGFQIDYCTVDDAAVTVIDSIKFDNITADHSVSVLFGLKSALSILSPRENAVLYAGDTIMVEWRTRGTNIQNVNVSFSVDNGVVFTPVASARTVTDTIITWIVPDVESETCVMKIADVTGSPATVTGRFSIRKKPIIQISTDVLALTVEQGKQKDANCVILNSGRGVLDVSVTTGKQLHQVVISELSIGRDADAPDAIEISNNGADINLSGFELIWEDNKVTSGSYRFPEGYVLKGGSTYLVQDSDGLVSDSVGYTGMQLQWLYSDLLELAVSLVDPAGLGIDFFKTIGSADQPPRGTAWNGDGVELVDAYVYRKSAADNDAADDWSCSSTGTLSAKYPVTERKSMQLTVRSLNDSIQGGGTFACALTLDGTGYELGQYTDTLIIYHNDPDTDSPLRIPCVISVIEAVGVKHQLVRKSLNEQKPCFAVAPNPVKRGKPVLFRYAPDGNEVQASLRLYNNVGSAIHTMPLDFSRVSILKSTPIDMYWTPDGSIRNTTIAARLTVLTRDGIKLIHSQLVAIE